MKVLFVENHHVFAATVVALFTSDYEVVTCCPKGAFADIEQVMKSVLAPARGV